MHFYIRINKMYDEQDTYLYENLPTSGDDLRRINKVVL